ncbi:MAG TPA: hypothetical protein EYP10_15705, partial [Armatimonadetes bacterium]|nr:hypothetical protein [Armatimonadota bacterium]
VRTRPVPAAVDDSAHVFECAAGDLFVLPAKKDSNGDMDGIPVALMESMGLEPPCTPMSLRLPSRSFRCSFSGPASIAGEDPVERT